MGWRLDRRSQSLEHNDGGGGGWEPRLRRLRRKRINNARPVRARTSSAPTTAPTITPVLNVCCLAAEVTLEGDADVSAVVDSDADA